MLRISDLGLGIGDWESLRLEQMGEKSKARRSHSPVFPFFPLSPFPRHRGLGIRGVYTSRVTHEEWRRTPNPKSQIRNPRSPSLGPL
jgi:hypothetical protein